MNPRSSILLALCLALVAPIAGARADPPTVSELTTLRQDVLDPFLQGLAAGDLPTIRRYLDADLYKQYRRLFEQNRDYGQFLQRYYAGASFTIRDIQRKRGNFIADVSVTWPDGRGTSMVLTIESGSIPPSQGHTPIVSGWNIHD